MRSLTLRLILVFLVISLFSVTLLAAAIRWSTNQEFSAFIFEQNQDRLVAVLRNYYQTNGSWAGYDPFGAMPMLMPHMRTDERRPGAYFTLAAPDGRVVVAGHAHRQGEIIPAEQLAGGIPIQVDGATVGVLFLEEAPFAQDPREADYLRRIDRLLLMSALGTALIALLLGVILSRTLTRPIRELTAATRAVSQGDLGQSVPVRSRDELGQLAASFNRMSAALKRSREQRRQMTADIAHELRTPLSLILGHAEAVHDGVLPPSRETFEIIRDEAGRLQDLIEDLRILSLADAGELPLNLQPNAPGKLLDDLKALYLPRAAQKRIGLSVENEAGLPEIEIDPLRMTQVLTNILDNALRHTPEGGAIRLAARRAADGIELSVADSGPGVAPGELERLFDRFYRADPSRQRADGGSGLGLAIAKSIVERHGGGIRAENARAGGLIVTIRLPLRAEQTSEV